jgi:hypothetical protein
MCASTGAKAQAVGSITGNVTDQQGKAMAGVAVTLTDPNTSFSVATKSEEDGSYTFLSVPPGPNYTLTFTQDGFRTLTVDKVILLVGTKETRDVKMIVGDKQTTVEVNARAGETLNTTDASIGTVVDGNRVQDLPSLFVNNAVNYLFLAPGVGPGGDVTGTRSDQTNVTLDGLDANDQRNGQAFVASFDLPLDTIQELKITSGGNDTTYGTSSGGQVELVTKSGTNNFHGQAFEFNRVTALAANDFFNKLNGVPNPQLIRNQFGGDIGGPIIKDKFWFFFSYNGLRTSATQSIDQVVPLGGIPAAPTGLRTGQVNYINTSGNVVATPLVGPNSLQSLDPQGIGANQALIQYFATGRPYPLANNFAVGDGLNTGGFFFVGPVKFNNNNYIGRLDFQATPNHRLFARANFDRSTDSDNVNHTVQVFPGDPAPGASIIDHSRSWVVGDTWVIGTNKTNQASFGQTTQLLAFPVNFKPTSPNEVNFFFNGNQITAPFLGLNEQFPKVPVYQIRDTFNWVRGTHTIQIGGVIKPVIFKSGNLTDTNLFSIGLGGNVFQAPAFPSDLDQTIPGLTSEFSAMYGIALGRYSTISANYNYDKAGNPILPQGNLPIRNYHGTEYEFFAQDSWRMRPSFTITYGLRWSFHNPLYEVNGFQSVPNLGPFNIFGVRVPQAAQGISGPNAVPLITYGLGGSANNGPGYYAPEYTNFAPRIGMAYSPSYTEGILGKIFGDRRSSIRAGFAINYNNTLVGQGFELDETSFLFSNSIVESFGLGAGDPRFAGTDAQGNFILPPIGAPGTTPRPTFTPNVNANNVPNGFFTGGGFGQGIFFNFDPHYHTPYEMSFSVGIQRELADNWLVSATYFGKLGRRLTALGDPAQTLNFLDSASGQFLYTAFGNVQKALQNGAVAGNNPATNVPLQPWFENQVGAAASQFGLTCPQTANLIFTAPSLQNLNCTNLAAALEGSFFFIGDTSSTILGLASFPGIAAFASNAQGFLLPNVGLLAQNGAAGYIGNYASSNYNALILSVNHRMTHNLTMEFNYTYSHSIDNDSGVQNNLITFSTSEICDLRNLRVCRASSDFDQRHNFVGNFIYGLPFGRGQKYGSDAGRPLNALIGNWSVSGIISAYSGNPFKVDSGAFTIDFTQTQGAVFMGSPSSFRRQIHAVPSGTAGVPPTIQYFGDVNGALNNLAFPFGGGPGDRNVLSGPSFWNVDLAVLKDFHMPWSDNQVLQFRAEFINAFNHVNFSNPGTSLLSPGTFGNISSDVNGPRNIQLALKYSF